MREVEDGLLLRWQEDADGVYVPEGVTTIGKGLFRGNTAIRSIDIPESVRTIGDFAFEDCRALERVTLHDGLKRLGDGCFRGCVSLKSLMLPDTVASLHANAFENCTALADVLLPGSLRRNIEPRTFACCTSLTKIVIPAGIQQIKRGAFSGCTALEEITFDNADVIIDKTAFIGCERLNTDALAFVEAHIARSDTVDINSRASGAAGRLSNYTERHFIFDQVECHSIEGVLQSLKCPDAAVQKEICLLVGGWAGKAGKAYDWRQDQTLYWQGKPYQRQSEDYAKLLDRLYDAVFQQDAGFRADLESLRGQRIDHRMGLTNPAETVLTRMEFVRELQRLIGKTASSP